MRKASMAGVLALLIFQGAAGYAQTNQNKDSLIEEKLVELALNGPLYKKSLHQTKLDEYQLKRAKDVWLNLLTISGNYNDQTFAKQQTPFGNIYPKFFVGVTLPLGILFSRTEVKAAREGIAIGKLNQEELRRSIRAEVIAKYRQYKAQGELIAIQTELLNDVETALQQAEEDFTKGKIKLDDYNAALKGRNDERAKLINLKLQQDLVRIDIEEMIGVNLDTVIK